MKEIYKYLPSSNLGVAFFASLILSVINFFILLVITNGNLHLTFILGIIIFFLAFFGLLISNSLGKAKHRDVLYNSFFKKLKHNLNLQVETLNENKYYGLKGYYKNYFIRIFYDWSTTLPHRYVFREVCIMLYFQPPVNANDQLDINLLDDLNKIYNKKGLFKPQFHRVTIEASYVKIQRAYTLFTTINDIVKMTEMAAEIAARENLEPIKEEFVNRLIDENKWLHGPDIETFHNNFKNLA